MLSRVIHALLAIGLLFPLTALSFDVSAYFDPVSIVTIDYCRGGSQLKCDNGSFEDFRLRLSSLANNADALRWYDEAGITILCVGYDSAEYFQDLAPYHFKVMNNLFLNGTYRYFEAQERH